MVTLYSYSKKTFLPRQVSIETLIKFVTGKDVGKKRGKKKGASPGILKRPVICICNDPYVPALRSLRQQAFVLHFPPTGSERHVHFMFCCCFV